MEGINPQNEFIEPVGAGQAEVTGEPTAFQSDAPEETSLPVTESSALSHIVPIDGIPIDGKKQLDWQIPKFGKPGNDETSEITIIVPSGNTPVPPNINLLPAEEAQPEPPQGATDPVARLAQFTNDPEAKRVFDKSYAEAMKVAIDRIRDFQKEHPASDR